MGAAHRKVLHLRIKQLLYTVGDTWARRSYCATGHGAYRWSWLLGPRALLLRVVTLNAEYLRNTWCSCRWPQILDCFPRLGMT